MLCHFLPMNTSKESEKFIYFLTLEVFKDYYCPQIKLQEGNGFTPVCHSVHRGISVQGVSVQWGSLSNGGLCPGCLCPGGLPRMGSLSRGVSVHGEGVCLGGLCPGGSPPPYSTEQAVHILLECILVLSSCTQCN